MTDQDQLARRLEVLVTALGYAWEDCPSACEDGQTYDPYAGASGYDPYDLCGTCGGVGEVLVRLEDLS